MSIAWFLRGGALLLIVACDAGGPAAPARDARVPMPDAAPPADGSVGAGDAGASSTGGDASAAGGDAGPAPGDAGGLPDSGPTPGLPDLPVVLRRDMSGYPDVHFTRPATIPSSDPRYMDSLLRANGWDPIELTRPNDIVDDPWGQTGPWMQYFYGAGHRAGTGAGVVNTLGLPAGPPPLAHALFSFDMVLANWWGNDASINKLGFLGLVGGGNQLFLVAYGRGDGPLDLRFMLQGVADFAIGMIPRQRGVEGCGSDYPNLDTANGVPDGSLDRICWELPSSAALRRDEVEHVDWEVKMSSAAGVPDAYVRVWLNGELVLHAYDLDLTHRATGSVHIQGIHWNGIFGGGGSPVPRDMAMLFRNFVLAGE